MYFQSSQEAAGATLLVELFPVETAKIFFSGIITEEEPTPLTNVLWLP